MHINQTFKHFFIVMTISYIFREPVFLDQSGQPISWPEYDLDSKTYLEIGNDMSEASVQNDLLPRAFTFWYEILPAIGGKKVQNKSQHL